MCRAIQLMIVGLFSFFFIVGFFFTELKAQQNEETISASGVGDLVVSLGRYKIGNEIEITFYGSGPWAEDGGIYHIIADWRGQAKITYASESAISDRLKLYGYIDPVTEGHHMFLYATWDNRSPDSAPNDIHFHITSTGPFDVNNTGDFSNSSELQSVLSVHTNGKVGIGTRFPTEKFTVNGTAKAKEVIVTEDVGADFVFEERYPLSSLSEVEQYIRKYKRLPEVPPASEMIREGVKVGELQMKLLQKIEELTLYVIELKKTNDVQQALLEKQQKLLQAQQKALDALNPNRN